MVKTLRNNEKSEIILLLLWQFVWRWLVWQGGKVVVTNSPSYRYISLWHPTSPYPIMHDIWHYLLAPWKEFFYISATWSDILPWSQKSAALNKAYYIRFDLNGLAKDPFVELKHERTCDCGRSFICIIVPLAMWDKSDSTVWSLSNMRSHTIRMGHITSQNFKYNLNTA